MFMQSFPDLIGFLAATVGIFGVTRDKDNKLTRVAPIAFIVALLAFGYGVWENYVDAREKQAAERVAAALEQTAHTAIRYQLEELANVLSEIASSERGPKLVNEDTVYLSQNQLDSHQRIRDGLVSRLSAYSATVDLEGKRWVSLSDNSLNNWANSDSNKRLFIQLEQVQFCLENTNSAIEHFGKKAVRSELENLEDLLGD